MSKERIEFDKEEFPEGGRGWIVVIGGWLSMCSVFGMVNSFGVYQSYYQTTKFPHESSYKISVIGALQPFCIYLFSIITVTLLNKFGTRITILIGGFLQIFSFMMLSITNSIWQIFLTQGLLFGIGSGIIYLSGLTIVMQWFKIKRPIAVGIISGGSSIGGVFWPIAVKRLIDSVGFDWMNRIIGFIYIPIVVTMCLTLEVRLPIDHSKIKLSVLKDYRFLLVIAANLLANFGLFPGLFYVDLYGKTLDPPFDSVYLVSILNAMSLAGRIIPGLLAHRIGQMNVLIPFLLVSGITPLTMWYLSTSFPLFLGFVIFWGFSTGVMVSLFPALVPQLFGIKDNHSRMSLFLAFSGLGALFGPMICGGFITNDLKGFDKVSIFVGVLVLAGVLSLVILRFLFTRHLIIMI